MYASFVFYFFLFVFFFLIDAVERSLSPAPTGIVSRLRVANNSLFFFHDTRPKN